MGMVPRYQIKGTMDGTCTPTWMSRWKLGSKVRINGLFHQLINGVYWGYNPLILNFDPNFLGHPSNSVPLVFIGVHLGILGDNLPINTYEL